MATNVWPSSIKPLRENFSESQVSRVIRSDTEIGPAKARRRSQIIITNITFDVVVDKTDLFTLKEFYEDNDSTIFYFTHPLTDEQITARFLSPFSYSIYETMYKSTFELEVLP